MSTERAPVSASELRPGDVIAGRYVLQKKLGEGGMGFVWVARSKALDVDVALKMLRPEIAGAEGLERMAREARTAAQLGHPAMVRVLDFGTTAQGTPFLAMELLHGEELQATLSREGRIPAERAAALLLPIIDGLGTAHEKGVVHRDIKPANIFIAADGQGRIQPKVLDFGIAKLDRSHVSTRLTQMGAVLGSPQYLSPEQAEGLEDVDARSDIWAVGVVLYELVTGAPPFEASNYNALIRRIMRDAPTPTTQLAAGDAQFWTILQRCLKKDPAERWASMWELGEALALWLFERGVRVDAASRSIKHDWLESGVTGLQILVASEAPIQTLPAGPGLALIDASGLPSPTDDRNARTVVRPRKKKSWLPSLIGFALAASALFALTVTWLRTRPVPPRAAEERAGAVVSSNVVAPTPPSEPASATTTAASALPAPIAADSVAEVTPAAPVVPSAVLTATQASLTKPRSPARSLGSSPSATQATTPPKAAPRKGLNTEFGF